MSKTPWTKSEVDDFVMWHEGRMAELQYPATICSELRRARDKFLPAPIKKEPNADRT